MSLKTTVHPHAYAGMTMNARNEIRKQLDIHKNYQDLPIQMQLEAIFKEICSFYGMHIEAVKSINRKQMFVRARHVYAHISRLSTRASLGTIGQIMGHRDHATVLNSFKVIENWLETDKRFKAEYEQILRILTTKLIIDEPSNTKL